MATRDEIFQAIRNADAAGDSASVQKLGAYLATMGNDAPATARPKTDYEEGKAKPGALQGLVSAINGPLMGFGDEVLGAVGGAYDTLTKGGKLKDNYIANRDTVRGMQDAQKEENPIVTGVTQMMTSAPLMLINPGAGAPAAAATAARTGGILANTGRAVATGAGYGAVGGAGNSTADTAGGVAWDALKGAGLGAATGGVVTPVVAGMGAGGRSVMARLSEASAAAVAREKLAEALARDARGSVFTSGDANPLAQMLARQNKLGPEAVLADAGGKNTNQLLDTLATLPGRTKDAVAQLQRQRTASAGDRLRTAADDALGTNGQRLATTVEDLMTTREAAAGPLYERLRQINITPSPELTAIVQAAEKLGAGSVAKKIATAKQLTYTLGEKDLSGSAIMGGSRPSAWSMRDLDLLKQGLDDIIAQSADKTGKLTPFGASVVGLNTALKKELDQATFDPRTGESLYHSARSAFAGPSALIDAAQAGRKAVASDEASIQGVLQGMGQSERDAFKVGAFEALRAKLGTQSGQTQILNMWKEPTTREKLQAIFGDERSFREFAAATAREGVLKRLQSVGTGSQTAARAAGMGDLDVGALADAAGAIGAAKSGNLLGALGSARNAWTRVGTPETVRNQMGQMLLSRGPEAQNNLNALSALLQQINERNTTPAAGGIGLIGSQLANRLVLP